MAIDFQVSTVTHTGTGQVDLEIAGFGEARGILYYGTLYADVQGTREIPGGGFWGFGARDSDGTSRYQSTSFRAADAANPSDVRGFKAMIPSSGELVVAATTGTSAAFTMTLDSVDPNIGPSDNGWQCNIGLNSFGLVRINYMLFKGPEIEVHIDRIAIPQTPGNTVTMRHWGSGTFGGTFVPNILGFTLGSGHIASEGHSGGEERYDHCFGVFAYRSDLDTFRQACLVSHQLDNTTPAFTTHLRDDRCHHTITRGAMEATGIDNNVITFTSRQNPGTGADTQVAVMAIRLPDENMPWVGTYTLPDNSSVDWFPSEQPGRTPHVYGAVASAIPAKNTDNTTDRAGNMSFSAVDRNAVVQGYSVVVEGQASPSNTESLSHAKFVDLWSGASGTMSQRVLLNGVNFVDAGISVSAADIATFDTTDPFALAWSINAETANVTVTETLTFADVVVGAAVIPIDETVTDAVDFADVVTAALVTPIDEVLTDTINFADVVTPLLLGPGEFDHIITDGIVFTDSCVTQLITAVDEPKGGQQAGCEVDEQMLLVWQQRQFQDDEEFLEALMALVCKLPNTMQ